MRDKLNKKTAQFFTAGRKKLRTIAICHKAAQIDNMSRSNTDTI